MSGTFLYPVQVLVCVKLLIKDKIGNTGTVPSQVANQMFKDYILSDNTKTNTGKYSITYCNTVGPL